MSCKACKGKPYSVCMDCVLMLSNAAKKDGYEVKDRKVTKPCKYQDDVFYCFKGKLSGDAVGTGRDCPECHGSGRVPGGTGI